MIRDIVNGWRLLASRIKVCKEEDKFSPSVSNVIFSFNVRVVASSRT